MSTDQSASTKVSVSFFVLILHISNANILRHIILSYLRSNILPPPKTRYQCVFSANWCEWIGLAMVWKLEFKIAVLLKPVPGKIVTFYGTHYYTHCISVSDKGVQASPRTSAWLSVECYGVNSIDRSQTVTKPVCCPIGWNPKRVIVTSSKRLWNHD